MLEGDAYAIEKEINPEAKKSYYGVGVDMNNKRKKPWCIRRLRDWLLEVKEHDPVTGVPSVKTIDWIFSKRILYELIAYEDGENFDHFSSLLCLMILLSKIHGWGPVELPNEEEEFEESEYIQYILRQQEQAESGRTSSSAAILKY